MVTYFERYSRGEHEQVWTELIALGAEVRQEPLYSDAMAVARETMRRARANIETIIRRLGELGYRFSTSRREAGLAMKQLDDLQKVMQSVWNQTADWRKSVETPGVYSDQARQSLLGMLQNTKSLLSGTNPLQQMVREKLAAKSQQQEPASPLEDPDVFAPPPAGVKRMMHQLEKKLGGPLPLSLRAWYETIGSVSLMGTHPALCFMEDQDADTAPAMYMNPAMFQGPEGTRQLEALRNSGVNVVSSLEERPGHDPILADPLVVAPLESILSDCGDWKECCESDEEPFRAVLAPDDLHKANISGGDYDIELPADGADTLFNDWHGKNFVDYLRITFRWGGFPGWERYPNRPEKELAYLREGLLPL